MIRGLSHVAIRTHDLALTIAFYTRVLGFAEIDRPASMTFPGAWLAPAGDMDASIHVYAGEAAGPAASGPVDAEDGSVDHVAYDARGFLEVRRRLSELALDWREQHRPGREVWQIFTHDPSGTKIELSFLESDEPELPAEADPARSYAPEERFFAPATFDTLARSLRSGKTRQAEPFPARVAAKH